MTPEEFSASVRQLESLLIAELPRINEKAALNASSLVKNRVINTGIGGDGDYLGEYADTPYKKFREKTGRQTDFVDLNYTGETMRDIGVVKTQSNNGIVETVVGPKNTKQRKGGVTTEEIVEGNAELYGNFLAPNEQEVKMIEGTIQKGVNDLIKKAFA